MQLTAPRVPARPAAGAARPRIGFVGLGWIGQHRMRAIADTGAAQIVALADPDAGAVAAAAEAAPAAVPLATLEEVLALAPDGVVIATPSALHAAQTIAALKAGAAVFCQKPLGRNAGEVAAAVAAARQADRLLAVDLSYRQTAAIRAIGDWIAAGELGEVFAADLTFHNAYGPDKPWFYDLAQAGGGCVMDLGVHLLDLALWLLGDPGVASVSAALWAGGQRLGPQAQVPEDHAMATITLATGAVLRLNCSWRLHLGADALIACDFHGTNGGASFRNEGGSFYDFSAHLHRGTARLGHVGPPDAWGGRVAADWARRLAQSRAFDAGADRLIPLAEALDGIYASAGIRR
ncbi:MAG: Gfo/Idh/MocA family oxidoreductase [Defluviimonas sp.]|nr:Gfo/Idh/MocA family oxidoreductase [Defluviimonas sp.]